MIMATYSKMKKSTFLIFILLLLAGALCALLLEGLFRGPGNPNELRITSFQDWRLVCPAVQSSDAGCSLATDVVRDQGGSLVSLSLEDPAAGSKLSITVPHGVLLDPGLGFSVGNDPLRVRPYETCTQVGCFALVTVDADTLQSLMDNENGQVVVVPGNGSPVTIPFSLKGFSEGHAALEQAFEQRNSFWSYLGR